MGIPSFGVFPSIHPRLVAPVRSSPDALYSPCNFDGIVAVDRQIGVGRVGIGHDRALVVGVEPASGGAAFEPDQRHVGADAVDEDARPDLGALIFGHQGIAVVEELKRPGRAARGLEQPPKRVVDQGRILRPGGGDEPVLDVVDEARRAVGREVAVGIVEKRGARAAVAGRARLRGDLAYFVPSQLIHRLPFKQNSGSKGNPRHWGCPRNRSR